MTEDKQAGWLTAAAVLVLFVALWEAMAGFILALATIIGLAFYKNAQRSGKARKAMVYGILGAVLAGLDAVAIHDIMTAGLAGTAAEMVMVAISLVLAGLVVYWEKKRSH